MRRGILGGTFDPVHIGHLLMAEMCRDALQLDQVHFVPAGDPPHKPGVPISPGKVRVEMLELAVAGASSFFIDRRELGRQGPTYTVDTLTEFREEFPDDDLYFLMGADSLRDFLTWREPDRIAGLAMLVTCNRPGVASPEAEQIVQWVGAQIAGRVQPLTIPGVAVSATDVRRRIAAGQSVRYLVPRAVEVFMTQHQLYRHNS
jgi:nicotinate-nucleotide adenylyltransferase